MKKLSNLNVDRKDNFGNFLLDLNPNLYISFLQNVETSPAPLNTPLLASESIPSCCCSYYYYFYSRLTIRKCPCLVISTK